VTTIEASVPAARGEVRARPRQPLDAADARATLLSNTALRSAAKNSGEVQSS
jgi:hypothetical protein